MSISALTVANYFIHKSLHESREFKPLTPMKLIKMIYLAHGLYLAEFSKPLIKENIIAWRYGPVIETVYHAFKQYGNGIITNTTTDKPHQSDLAEQQQHCNKVTKLLDKVWDSCLDISGIQLSNWSHEAGSPWDQTYNTSVHGKNGKKRINNGLIRDYFAKAA